jgi:uncharacterized SAM-binding protein YcdF (DUF218 family)
MQTMYFARHAVDALVDPLVVALLLGLLAALLWRRGRQAVGGWLLVSAGIVVYVFSLVPVGDLMLRPLERQYPSIGARAQLPAVRYVVVLGSSYSPRPDVSPVSALDCEGLVRIVEGVRMVRRLPGARLIVSGGAPAGREPVAHGYARLARDLGIDETSITVLDTPLNTDAEARSIAAAIGSQPFLLVTSAWHMPRAMRLMDRARAEAIPVPIGQQTGAPCGSYLWSCFLPGSAGLRRTELAVHEYLGLAALALNLE